MSPDPTPFKVVTALQANPDEARPVLDRWCRRPLSRLIDAVAGRLGPGVETSERLTARALRWLEMYLRSRDPASYKSLRRETFVTSLMLAAYRWLDPTEAGVSGQTASYPGDPVCEVYELRSYTSPLDRVGGDWWDHDAGPGSLFWVIVCDVTGHGYPAYLLAAGLPHLWRSSPIAQLRDAACEPRALLGALGRELESVLPDELFVEAALGRFAPSGEAVLAAAGGCCPVLRRSGSDRPEIRSLSGCFLGLEWGDRDQESCTLGDGDELLLATDGLFDQPCGGSDRLKARLAEWAGERLAAGLGLHDAVIEILSRALKAARQHDDITVVTLCRRLNRLRAPGSPDARL
jgi:hypothetical protein